MWILGLKGLKSNMATTTTKMGLNCNSNEEKYNTIFNYTKRDMVSFSMRQPAVMWLCQISMNHQEISLQTLSKCLLYLF